MATLFQVTKDQVIDVSFVTVIGGKPQYGAEIAVHPNGKWLFASNSGQGPLCVYHIDENDPSKLSIQQVLTFMR